MKYIYIIFIALTLSSCTVQRIDFSTMTQEEREQYQARYFVNNHYDTFSSYLYGYGIYNRPYFNSYNGRFNWYGYGNRHNYYRRNSFNTRYNNGRNQQYNSYTKPRATTPTKANTTPRPPRQAPVSRPVVAPRPPKNKGNRQQ